MKKFWATLIFLIVVGCGNELADPWAHVDYTEAACGTKQAILTTVGCSINPDVAIVMNNNNPPISNPNDVSAPASPASAHHG